MADGSYITQAQVIALFGSERELASLTNDTATGVVNTEALDDAIQWGEGVINSYVAVRHLTPVDVSTDTSLAAYLRRIAGCLAEYKLRIRKPPVDPSTQERYDQTIATLASLAAGEIALPGAETPAAPTSQNPLASFSYGNRTLPSVSNRIFSRGTSGRL